jgi:hypothetical protein
MNQHITGPAGQMFPSRILPNVGPRLPNVGPRNPASDLAAMIPGANDAARCQRWSAMQNAEHLYRAAKMIFDTTPDQLTLDQQRLIARAVSDINTFCLAGALGRNERAPQGISFMFGQPAQKYRVGGQVAGDTPAPDPIVFTSKNYLVGAAVGTVVGATVGALVMHMSMKSKRSSKSRSKK